MTIYKDNLFRVPLYSGDDFPRLMHIGGRYIFPSQYVFSPLTDLYNIKTPVSFSGRYSTQDMPMLLYQPSSGNFYQPLVNSDSYVDLDETGAANMQHIINKGDNWMAILTNEYSAHRNSIFRSYFIRRQDVATDPSRSFVNNICSFNDYHNYNYITGATDGDSIHVSNFGNNGQSAYGVTSAHFDMWCVYEVIKINTAPLNPVIDNARIQFVNSAIPTISQTQTRPVNTHTLRYIPDFSSTQHAQLFLAKTTIDFMPYSTLSPVQGYDRVATGGYTSDWHWHFINPAVASNVEMYVYIRALGFEAHVG